MRSYICQNTILNVRIWKCYWRVNLYSRIEHLYGAWIKHFSYAWKWSIYLCIKRICNYLLFLGSIVQSSSVTLRSEVLINATKPATATKTKLFPQILFRYSITYALSYFSTHTLTSAFPREIIAKLSYIWLNIKKNWATKLYHIWVIIFITSFPFLL